MSGPEIQIHWTQWWLLRALGWFICILLGTLAIVGVASLNHYQVPSRPSDQLWAAGTEFPVYGGGVADAANYSFYVPGGASFKHVQGTLNATPGTTICIEGTQGTVGQYCATTTATCPWTYCEYGIQTLTGDQVVPGGNYILSFVSNGSETVVAVSTIHLTQGFG